MDVGVMVPQGWKGEYDGWNAVDAWANAVALARQAEALGFESVWVFDHFTTVPDPTDEITFESFTMLGALASATSRLRLGHMVICTGFRNPALTAKMASTLDVISGGRFELGIGAGWKEDEWVAYGYGFPSLRERLAALADHLEIIRRMLEPGRASYEGRYARVDGAINVPKGVQQPRIPIIVGGNGQNVTFRLAARFADELNLVFLGPDGGGRAHGRRAPAVRGGGPRPGDAPHLALLPRRRRPARRPGAGRPAGRVRGRRARPARRVPVALGHVGRRPGPLRRGRSRRRAPARGRVGGRAGRDQRSRPTLPGGP